jgi:hypothetical protein
MSSLAGVGHVNQGQAAIASIFQGCIFFIDSNARLFVPEVLSGEQPSQDFAHASAHELAEQITKRGGTVLSGGFKCCFAVSTVRGCPLFPSCASFAFCIL